MFDWRPVCALVQSIRPCSDSSCRGHIQKYVQYPPRLALTTIFRLQPSEKLQALNTWSAYNVWLLVFRSAIRVRLTDVIATNVRVLLLNRLRLVLLVLGYGSGMMWSEWQDWPKFHVSWLHDSMIYMSSRYPCRSYTLEIRGMLTRLTLKISLQWRCRRTSVWSSSDRFWNEGLADIICPGGGSGAWQKVTLRSVCPAELSFEKTYLEPFLFLSTCSQAISEDGKR